jgi:hypothetical protein
MKAPSWLAAPLALAIVAIVAGCAEAPPEAPLPQIPAQMGAQRLTQVQYRNAIHDLFGDDIAVPTSLEPDTTLNGFVSIGASQSSISSRGVEQYEDAAFKIAAMVTADEARLARVLPCKPAKVDDAACAEAFARSFGRRAWRRPLGDDEVAAITDVTVKAGATLGDFKRGLEFGIAALLQAPSFLYRAPAGEPDPAHAGKRRLTGHELASRLSFFLWNSIPDEALLDAADQGLLTTDRGLAEQVFRMMESPRAKQGLRNFVTEYLGLAALDTLSKDPTIFTYYSPDVGPAAREEILLGFERVAFDLDADFRQIFLTRTTFVNPKLASMYRVPAPEDEGFGQVVLPTTSLRRGLLGAIGILALYAHPTSSSATLRGKFVRTVLLCDGIPPPPVDVNTALPEPSGTAKTLRDRVKEHLSNPMCNGCHRSMDPIGLGLENFDGLGLARAEDNGEVIDASGELDGQHFDGPVSLAHAIAEHPKVPECFVKNMYRYATSFVEGPEEKAMLEGLTQEFEASGHRMKALMIAIATSPAFRLAGEPR